MLAAVAVLVAAVVADDADDAGEPSPDADG
jgi:hypothetical protein